jgi:alpha-galactosidase
VGTARQHDTLVCEESLKVQQVAVGSHSFDDLGADGETDRLLEDLKRELAPSVEYGAAIVHSMETGRESVIYGNVPNTGLVTNLPDGCCVEVACLVNGNGVQPTVFGALPPQCAAVNRTGVNVQELAVTAALTGRREHVYHAVMADPLTSTLLTLDRIRAMVDDLFAAHKAYLPDELQA